MKTILCMLFSVITAAAVELKPGDDLQAALNTAEEIRLAPGTYFVTEPLRIERPVRVIGADGVVISGGQKITGWKHIDGMRWEAQLPEVAEGNWRFRDLYIGDAKATRARHPDKDTFRVAAAGEDKRTSFSFNGDDLKAWKNPQQIEFVFYHDWSLSRVNLASVDIKKKTATLRDPVGQTTASHYAMDWFEKQPRYHLENHPDFLTVPGEWFLDEKTGMLTFLAAEGEDPNETKIIAPRADGLLDVTNAKNVRLENLTFRHMNWALPPGGCAGVQAAFHQVRPAQGTYENRREAKPAAVTVDQSSDCVFKNCAFEQFSASALWVREKCRDILIENCIVRNVGANGIMIATDQTSDDATARVHVKDTLIEHCGLTDFGAVGIWVGLGNHITIQNCELRELPYTGISIGWRWSPGATSCHHNIVDGCHIHHIMQKLSDGGGIYTLGSQPGTILRSNRIHDVPVNAGRAESNGMFLDEGTTGIVIEKNTIWNIAKSPLRFHKAGKNLVQNNQLYRGTGTIPMVRYNSTPEENIELKDNEGKVGAPE